MRLFLYLFLILILYNIIGYYPLFLCIQQQVKHDVKERIKNAVPEEELTAFSFTEAEYKELDWLEKDEFRFHEEMYDVVKKKTDLNGNIVVYVIDDKKEKELLINLEQQAQESTEDSEAGEKILKLFSSSYLPIHELIYFIPEKSLLPPLSDQSPYISFVREILPPPPKSV